MKVQPINYSANRNNNFGSRLIEPASSERFRQFMRQLDSRTTRELEKIQQKYKNNCIEKEAAIDAVFYRREKEIQLMEDELFPKQQSPLKRILSTFGLL